MSESADYAVSLQAVLSSNIKLSAPAEIYLSTALDVVDAVAGAPLETLTTEAVGALPASLVAEVGGAIAGLAATVPVVGAFSGVMAGVLTGAIQAENERMSRERNEEQVARAIQPSGSLLGGCIECPCDLFVQNIVSMPERGVLRPLIGDCLIAVTEGGRPNLPPLEVEKVARIGVRSDATDRYASVARASGSSIPEDRRRIFHAMRRAIEQAWRPPGGGGLPPSDAGSSLWPAYLDYLLREYDEGHLGRTYMRWAVAGLKFVGEEIFIPPEYKLLTYPYVDAISEQGGDGLVQRWESTVRPAYVDGQRLLADLERYRELMHPAKFAIRRTLLARSGRASIGKVVGRPGRSLARIAVLGGAGAAGLYILRPDIALRALSALRSLLHR